MLDASSGTRVRLPILLAIACGLRRGEILPARWSDLDWLGRTLRISRSLEETKAGIRFKEPKTRRGYLSIAVPPFALEILKDHRRAQHELKERLGSDYQDQDLICCAENGEIWKPSAFTSAYRDLLRRRKLNGPNFHALRHSHASHLLRAGVDVKLISHRLGHSRTAFTLDTYAHILPGQDAEAARRVEKSYQSVRNADPDHSVSKALANDLAPGRKQPIRVS